jgi:hypothetical protein
VPKYPPGLRKQAQSLVSLLLRFREAPVQSQTDPDTDDVSDMPRYRPQVQEAPCR